MNGFSCTAHTSSARGSVYGNNNVLNEVTACVNVGNKCRNGLPCGSMDPSVTIPKISTKSKVDGIDRIIVEGQRQLDEWATGRDQ